MAGVRYRLRVLLRNGVPASIAMAIAVAALAAIVLVLTAGAVRTLTAPARYTTSNGLTYDAFAQQDDLQPPRTKEIASLNGVEHVVRRELHLRRDDPTRQASLTTTCSCSAVSRWP